MEVLRPGRVSACERDLRLDLEILPQRVEHAAVLVERELNRAVCLRLIHIAGDLELAEMIWLNQRDQQ